MTTHDNSGPDSPLRDTGPVPYPGTTDSGSTTPAGTDSTGTTDTAKGESKRVAQDAKQSGQQVAQEAKQSGQQVAQEAKEGGQQVAEVVKQEAGNVASTVSTQASSLLQQARSELSDQTSSQQQRLAEGVRSLSEELKTMAQGGQKQSGPASDLVRQASERTQSIAGWLEGNDPATMLQEVKRFARRRPGTFIGIAAGVGLLAGRLTRGLSSDSQSGGAQGSGTGGYQGGSDYRAPAPTYPAAPSSGDAAAGAPVGTAMGAPGQAGEPAYSSETGIGERDLVGYEDDALGYPQDDLRTDDRPGLR